MIEHLPRAGRMCDRGTAARIRIAARARACQAALAARPTRPPIAVKLNRACAR